LKKQCDNHARIVSTSAMTCHEAWTYYFSMYLTSPGYPLPLSHFLPSELYNLETKSFPALIAKCGFNRNKHWTSNLPVGKVLQIAIAWAQLHTRVGWSVCQNVTSPLPQFEESQWLQVIRNFLKSIRGCFRLDKTYVPPLQRKNDSYIMDHILDSNQFKPIDIQKINYCRMYLQAITVSDISNASGTRLLPGVVQGDLSNITSTTNWHWIHQARPERTSWKLRNHACNLFSSADGILHEDLHEWLHSPHDLRQKWPFYYDPVTDTLLSTTDTLAIHVRNCQTFEFASTANLPELLPQSYYLVDVQQTYYLGWRVV
jgi:hypothetical protein